MITCKVGKMIRENNLCLFHTKKDFDMMVQEHNKLVDALNIAYKEINRLSNEIKLLKKEYPQTIILEDFLEKYPNAPLNDWGMPLRVCPIDLGYEDRTTQSCFDECADCWNRPIGE